MVNGIALIFTSFGFNLHGSHIKLSKFRGGLGCAYRFTSEFVKGHDSFIY